MPVWWNAYTLRLERSAGRIGGSSPSTGTNFPPIRDLQLEGSARKAGNWS